MIGGLRVKRYRRPELPLVPLIDVLVMLVLFAFVTMRFSASQTLNITVPQAQTAGKNEIVGKLEVAIDKAGKIYVSGVPVSESELDDLLKKAHDVSRDTTVLIRADSDAVIGKMITVMDASRKAGLKSYRIQTRSK